MSLIGSIFKNQSPWGSSGPTGGSGNGSGSRREPPNIDELIRNIQNKQKGIQDDQFYRLAELKNPDAILSIFLHKDIREVMNKLFTKTKYFPFLGNSWFSFDFNTKKDPFTLDGISFVNDSIPDRLTLYKNLIQTVQSPENRVTTLTLT